MAPHPTRTNGPSVRKDHTSAVPDQAPQANRETMTQPVLNTKKASPQVVRAARSTGSTTVAVQPPTGTQGAKAPTAPVGPPPASVATPTLPMSKAKKPSPQVAQTARAVRQTTVAVQPPTGTQAAHASTASGRASPANVATAKPPVANAKKPSPQVAQTARAVRQTTVAVQPPTGTQAAHASTASGRASPANVATAKPPVANAKKPSPQVAQTARAVRQTTVAVQPPTGTQAAHASTASGRASPANVATAKPPVANAKKPSPQVARAATQAAHASTAPMDAPPVNAVTARPPVSNGKKSTPQITEAPCVASSSLDDDGSELQPQFSARPTAVSAVLADESVVELGEQANSWHDDPQLYHSATYQRDQGDELPAKKRKTSHGDTAVNASRAPQTRDLIDERLQSTYQDYDSEASPDGNNDVYDGNASDSAGPDNDTMPTEGWYDETVVDTEENEDVGSTSEDPQLSAYVFADLNDTVDDLWSVDARVLCAPTVKPWNNMHRSGQRMECQLMDRDGAKITATIFNQGIDQFRSVVYHGATCCFTEGRIQRTNPKFSQETFQLTFDERSNIYVVPADYVPDPSHSFASMKIVEVGDARHHSSVSLLGILSKAGQSKYITTHATGESKKLQEFLLVDDSGAEVVCAAWGYQVPPDLAAYVGKPVLITRGRVSIYQTTITVNVGVGSLMMLDPCLAEADVLFAWYTSLPQGTHMARVSSAHG